MKIKYDRELCQGHNRCHSLAPELFEVDDLGWAIQRSDDDVPGCASQCFVDETGLSDDFVSMNITAIKTLIEMKRCSTFREHLAQVVH